LAKHYIRVNENNFITRGFTTDFEQPELGDICVDEDGGRHFEREILRPDGLPALKYENEEIVRTLDEDLISELRILTLRDEKEQLVQALRQEHFSEWFEASLDDSAVRVKEIETELGER